MKINRYSILAVSISLCLSSTAYSGGFTVTVQSASSGGTASTNHAMAEDASAMFYNPALLSSVEGTQVNGGISLTSPDMTVTNAGSENPTGVPLFTNIIRSSANGENVAEPANLGATPSLYYKRDISPKMAFGLGLNVPHGVSTEYEKDSFARYEATESGLSALNVNPALSWKVNDMLDLGAGLNIQYATAILAKSLDSYAVCARQLPTATCTALGINGFNDPTSDSSSSVEADSVALGFNLGGVYRPNASTTISLGYRSAVKHELEGDVDFTLDSKLPAAFAAALADQKATADLELPATASLAFAKKVNSKLTIHGDATWTDWSSVPEIRIVFPDDTAGNIGDSVTDLQWEDTIRVGGGVTYQLSDKTRLRGGIAFDPTPTPSSEKRTPRAPSSDTFWFSVGAGHDFSKKLSLDASLAYIHPEEMKINYRAVGDSGYLTKANAEVSAISATISLNYRFK